ncbi:MAG: alginate export family protein, partial [Solirubrobacteraceae bacterium]
MITFDDGKGSISVNDRLRWEDRENNFDFDSSANAPTDGTWLLQRFRVGAAWKPESDLSLQVQLQDVREWGSDRPKVPFIQGAEGNEPLNLHVASLTYGTPKDPFQFTVGRQVISLGEERLVGPGEWNNFARVFDAGKLVWNMVPGKATTTFFVSSVVNVEPTTSGAPWKLEHSNANDLFSGAYFSDKATARDTFEAYLFWRDKTTNDPIYTAPSAPIPVPARSAAAYDIAQDIYTMGGRYLRTPKPGTFDAEVELATQWGHVNRQTTAATGPYAGTTPTLDQNAWALHTLLGYMPLGAPGKLRFDVEYNVASGDTNRNDNKNGSFMTLFPSGHKWYGFMDVISWKNLREAVATVRFNPT